MENYDDGKLMAYFVLQFGEDCVDDGKILIEDMEKDGREAGDFLHISRNPFPTEWR